ncbi:MAG: Pycsar system effector family protein [Sediminibacterium sp.]
MPEVTDQTQTIEPSSEPTVLTPDGFGKDVNDYLNHYVTVADAKAAAILASNFIVLGALTTIEAKTCILSVGFFITGITSLISILYCITTLYPRLSHAGKGLIFWESIRQHNSQEDYLKELAKLDSKVKEVEYGKQNWHVSSVLSSKNNQIRNSLWTFGISVLLLSAVYIISKFL